MGNKKNEINICRRVIDIKDVDELCKFTNDTELKKHILYLFQAIMNVDHSYLWYLDDSRNLQENEDNKLKFEHLERVFAYELYHQWSIILKNEESDLTINSEISKKILDDNCKYLTVYPDFVLHNGQEKTDKQYIVCEVKRKTGLTKDKIKEDLDALSTYLDAKKFDNKKFKIGVFILVGTDMETLKTFIGEISEIHFGEKDIPQRILCVTYDYDSNSKQYSFSACTLNDIFSESKKKDLVTCTNLPNNN